LFPGLLPQKTQILLNLDCFISVSFSISLSVSLFFSHRGNTFYVPHWTKWMSGWWCKRASMLYITVAQAKGCTRPHLITDDDADSHNLYVETEGDLIQWCVCFLLYHGPLSTTNEKKKKIYKQSVVLSYVKMRWLWFIFINFVDVEMDSNFND